MKNLVWLIALSALALAGGSALQSSEPEFELARAHVETADMLDQMEPDTGERDLRGGRGDAPPHSQRHLGADQHADPGAGNVLLPGG